MVSQQIKPTITGKMWADIPISNEILKELMREVLAKGASFHFQARGLSMTPFIKDRDKITIVPVSKEKPGFGKVVAFIKPSSGQLEIHRIIGKQGSSYLIRGDNTAGQRDGLVQLRNILGCVGRVERSGRRIRLGTGLERYLVALFSRMGILTFLLNTYRKYRALYLSKTK
jgi:hypothetical protein